MPICKMCKKEINESSNMVGQCQECYQVMIKDLIDSINSMSNTKCKLKELVIIIPDDLDDE